MYQSIIAEVEAGVKTITLNAPKYRNAYDEQMATEVIDALESDYENPEVRVYVLTGAGEHFSAGANLKNSSANATPDGMGKHIKEVLNPLVIAIQKCPKPVIAKVRGNAVGAGLGWVLACDLVYVSDTAKLSAIFTRIGLSPDAGASWFLYERLGYHKAFELMATAKMISGAEAAQLGLANQLFPDDQLDEAVKQIAQQLAEGPTVAYSSVKANLQAARLVGLEKVLAQERESQMINAGTEDFMEGVMAFLQKRKATFKGK